MDYEWMLVPHYTGPKQNTEGYQGAPHAPLAASSPSFPVGKTLSDINDKPLPSIQICLTESAEKGHFRRNGTRKQAC